MQEPLYELREAHRLWFMVELSLMHAMQMKTVFAIITTVVKYVRIVQHQTGHFECHNSTKMECRYVRYRSICAIDDKFVWPR
jgi:hypothetical protein